MEGMKRTIGGLNGEQVVLLVVGCWMTRNHPYGRNEKDNRRIEWRTSNFTGSWTTRNHPHGRNELEQNLHLCLIKGS